MNTIISKFFSFLWVFILLFFFCNQNLDAKSTGSSRSGFSSGRSSSPKSTPKPSTPSSKPATNTSGGWGGTPVKKPNNPSPPPKPIIKTASGKNVDSAAYEKAVKDGKAFKSREAAINDFKQKKQNQYKNSFETEPATRPNYIPTKTNVDGRDYDVSYNPTTRNYGYYGAGGGWNALDVFRDVALISLLMDNDGYVVQQQGPAPAPIQSTNYAQSNSGIGFFGWTMIIVIGIVIIVGIYLVVNSKF